MFQWQEWHLQRLRGQNLPLLPMELKETSLIGVERSSGEGSGGGVRAAGPGLRTLAFVPRGMGGLEPP